MDHYELGRVAFEKRQLSEAEIHFSRIAETLPPDQHHQLHLMKFEIAKAMRAETCWRELRAVAEILFQQQKWNELHDLLANERAHVPQMQSGFVLEYLSAIHFQKGELAQARSMAMQHVNHLLQKKLSAHLLHFAQLYAHQFPQTLYFSFIQLQAAVMLEDIPTADKVYQSIVETIHRRWVRIEDNQHASKLELLNTATEAIRLLDTVNGEAVLLGHYASLIEMLLSNTKLAKEDWKKLIELVVDSDSWRRLKLVVELAVNHNEKEIALEAHAALKRKRGFSFVKLTKYDPHLKEWLLDHGGNRPARPQEEAAKVIITAEDLKLGEEPTANTSSSEFDRLSDDEVTEQRMIETNAIKQLQFHAPGIELLPDLLVAYKTMGFHKVVGWLLETYGPQAESIELKKKVSYFRVLNAMDLKQSHLALALIEEMLGDTSLTLDEFKELKYAQGSLLLSVGRKGEARLSFREVERVDPSYRQLRERMQRIATN